MERAGGYAWASMTLLSTYFLPTEREPPADADPQAWLFCWLPETVRANRMPIMMPLVTVPTTRPRSLGRASAAPMKQRTWRLSKR